MTKNTEKGHDDDEQPPWTRDADASQVPSSVFYYYYFYLHNEPNELNST